MNVLVLFYFISDSIADCFVCTVIAFFIMDSNEVGVISWVISVSSLVHTLHQTIRYLMSVLALFCFISDSIAGCFVCTITACFKKDLKEIGMLSPKYPV